MNLHCAAFLYDNALADLALICLLIATYGLLRLAVLAGIAETCVANAIAGTHYPINRHHANVLYTTARSHYLDLSRYPADYGRIDCMGGAESDRCRSVEVTLSVIASRRTA